MTYAHPESLVSAEWLKSNLSNPTIRIIEVDVDPKQYAAGHIPGAIGLDWAKDLQDPVRRDIPTGDQLSSLLSSRGVGNEHTIVLYGDSANWFAAYAFWVLKLYGHRDVRLLNGGRALWLNDSSLPLTPEVVDHPPTTYRPTQPDETLRARVSEVLVSASGAARVAAGGAKLLQLVDVRSPDEFSGKIIAPPGMNETAQRAGHIPGAVNVPWAQATNPDGTFKSADELRTLYGGKGLTPGAPTVAYCRIGERSSHTWFVLKYLLGFDNVRNYDGSWTEYGNLIGAPIQKNV
jgi:thiosulfate/3-mercaptopyruvate sulfurtransferase